VIGGGGVATADVEALPFELVVMNVEKRNWERRRDAAGSVRSQVQLATLPFMGSLRYDCFLAVGLQRRWLRLVRATIPVNMCRDSCKNILCTRPFPLVHRKMGIRRWSQRLRFTASTGCSLRGRGMSRGVVKTSRLCTLTWVLDLTCPATWASRRARPALPT
jgi:hypothetical protein